MCVAVECVGGQTHFFQQFVQQHAGAGAQWPVDVAGLRLCHLSQVVQAQRVAGGHHQPHLAQSESNDLVLARLQQGLVGAGRQTVAVRPLAGVESGQLAAPFVERADGIDTAGEVNVQVQAGVLAGQVLQRAERVVVAGVQAQHLGALVKHAGQGTFQLGAQGLDLRSQPGLGQALGPQQLVGKRGQAGGLPTVPQDEGLAHFNFPLFQLAPHMAIRQTQLPRCPRNGAALPGGLQQIKQRVAQQRAALALAGELVHQRHPGCRDGAECGAGRGVGGRRGGAVRVVVGRGVRRQHGLSLPHVLTALAKTWGNVCKPFHTVSTPKIQPAFCPYHSASPAIGNTAVLRGVWLRFRVSFQRVFSVQAASFLLLSIPLSQPWSVPRSTVRMGLIRA